MRLAFPTFVVTVLLVTGVARVHAAEEPSAPPAVATPAPAAATPAPATPAPTPAAGDEDDWDDSDDADLDELMDKPLEEGGGWGGGWDEEKKPQVYPWFEHHGYFRFRSDLFWRAHLGTDRNPQGLGTTVGTSGFLPPITHNDENNGGGGGDPEDVGRGRDDETIAGANLRFRYTPTLHLTSDLRIGAQFDVLDNVVLGSTPDFAGTLSSLRPDVPFVVLSDSAVPPESGRNTFQDSIRVKQAFGEWHSLIGLLRFGRMSSHWGLGIFQNGGQDPDSDYGDFLDRVMWTGQFWGIYTMAAWDFASEGPTSEGAGQFFGQPYDLDQSDDVNQWVIGVYQRPVSEEELAIRKRDLDERRVPVFDWGLYNLFRMQDLDLSQASGAKVVQDLGYATQSWDEVQLVQRDAWVWIPDLWLRFEWRPAYGKKLHVELEAAIVYGRFNAALSADGDDPTNQEVDILQYGGVLQADYTTGGLSFGLELGVASGDDAEGLGVLDEQNVFAADGDTLQVNRKLTNFIFDRDYHTDLLLFREVIGAVTNAVYFKPWIQYDLFAGDEAALGARLDIEYARALEPDATPGNDPNYGLELDLRIFYEDSSRFLASLEWGILFPFGAFDLVDGYGGYSGNGVSAKWATTLQARVHWMF